MILLATFTLFSIVNPFGAMPITTADDKPSDQISPSRSSAVAILSFSGSQYILNFFWHQHPALAHRGRHSAHALGV
jgi:hypothetical protein